MPDNAPPPDGPARPDGVHTLDPRSLRGLAHPLRVRLLVDLRENGPATASRLAARLGESSGATSYHLRQLAAHGFVVEDPGRGTARERWWRARYRGIRMDRGELLSHPDPAVRDAADLVVQEMAAGHAQELDAWLAALHEWPEPWRSAWDLSDFTLRLTPQHAHELRRRLHEVVEEFRGDPPAAEGTGSGEPAGPAETVRVHLHAFPRATRSSGDPDTG